MSEINNSSINPDYDSNSNIESGNEDRLLEISIEDEQLNFASVFSANYFPSNLSQDQISNPSNIKTEITNNYKNIKNITEPKIKKFPIEVFPIQIQDIILATHQCLGFPIDFIGASMLFTCSVAIGNTYKVEVTKGWQETAILYLALVGRAGTNKSHPLSFALQPIFDQDKKTYHQYEVERWILRSKFTSISAQSLPPEGRCCSSCNLVVFLFS